MAKPPGCFQRGSVWYIRIIVPPDLVATFGRSCVVLSLGTSDRKEAYVLATLKRAEWMADFEAKRSALNAVPAVAITPDMGALLADLVRAQVLADDDRVRQDVALLAEMVHMRAEHKRLTRNRLMIPRWNLPEPRIDDLSGATEDERRELAELNAYLDGDAAIALAGEVLPRQDLARDSFEAQLPVQHDHLSGSLKVARLGLIGGAFGVVASFRRKPIVTSRRPSTPAPTAPSRVKDGAPVPSLVRPPPPPPPAPVGK